MKCMKHGDRKAVGFLVKLGMKFLMCRECLDNAVMAGEVVSMMD
jgi:hypothetical protein